jgi:hypothetical protein
MSYPKFLLLKKKQLGINLIIKGQGVLLFKNDDNSKQCLLSINNSQNTDGLSVLFTKQGLEVNKITNNEKLVDIKNRLIGLIDNKRAYYWFSIDAQNQKLVAGLGEARLENIDYEYQFPVSKENKDFLESLVNISINEASTSFIPIKLLRDPVTVSIPLLVKDTNFLTMNHIAKSSYLPKSNLSQAAQILYECIAGKKFVLDDKDFPQFSKAIEYSIATPGCWCYKKLQEKSREFSKEGNILETYLRITLGQNNGESPGIPYVMEIWPIGHYSPIHNHAGANAIIRVLHGKINVSLFSFLSNELTPFAKVDFKKDDITWISPTLNQTHQLKNLDKNKNTCITIQCYMYGTDNDIHYDYFDYLDPTGIVQQYEPDSDMDFIDFKKLMKQEWNNRLTKKFSCLFN